MSDLIFISGKAALSQFMDAIRTDVQSSLQERKINASRRLTNSTRWEVIEGPSWTTGTLYALDYWKRAGSGSPPGTIAKPTELARWALSKGLANNDRAALRFGNLVSTKIRKYGSKDHREGNSNVYTDAIQRASVNIPKVVEVFVRDLGTATAREFKTAFR